MLIFKLRSQRENRVYNLLFAQYLRNLLVADYNIVKVKLNSERLISNDNIYSMQTKCKLSILLNEWNDKESKLFHEK